MDPVAERFKRLLKQDKLAALDFARETGLIRSLSKLDPVWHVMDMGIIPDPWQAKLLRSPIWCRGMTLNTICRKSDALVIWIL